MASILANMGEHFLRKPKHFLGYGIHRVTATSVLLRVWSTVRPYLYVARASK